MKKILCAMLLAIGGCMTAMAGSDIRVTEGDKKFLKTVRGNAELVFNWDEATFDNTEPLSSKFSNLEELKKVAWNGFAETFNEKSSNVKVVRGGSDIQYRFLMKVSNMDQYFKVMGFIPSPATKVWGEMIVTDITTGDVIAKIEVKEVDGGANPSPDGTFSDCFEELAKQVSKLK